jgi:polyribonucleotide nucleotidyltransferase
MNNNAYLITTLDIDNKISHHIIEARFAGMAYIKAGKQVNGEIKDATHSLLDHHWLSLNELKELNKEVLLGTQ